MNLEITDPNFNEKNMALQALQEVSDPELGINIVDLGLVYNIVVSGDEMRIDMTLSTKSCPLGGMITAHAKLAVTQVLPQYNIVVQLVWDPKWNAAMVSEEGKAMLGW